MMSSPTKVVRAARWLVALCMTGCPTADDMPAPDSGAGSGGPGTGTEVGTGNGTGTGTEVGTGAENETETDASPTSSSGEASVPWSDLECDMEVCEGSDLCFKPAAYCTGPCVDNYQDLVNPPRRCEPLPTDCDPLDPRSCVVDALCDVEGGQFGDGYLTCYGANDCYCR